MKSTLMFNLSLAAAVMALLLATSATGTAACPDLRLSWPLLTLLSPFSLFCHVREFERLAKALQGNTTNLQHRIL